VESSRKRAEWRAVLGEEDCRKRAGWWAVLGEKDCRKRAGWWAVLEGGGQPEARGVVCGSGAALAECRLEAHAGG